MCQQPLSVLIFTLWISRLVWRLKFRAIPWIKSLWFLSAAHPHARAGNACGKARLDTV
jgi:hypothetical protein